MGALSLSGLAKLGKVPVCITTSVFNFLLCVLGAMFLCLLCHLFQYICRKLNSFVLVVEAWIMKRITEELRRRKYRSICSRGLSSSTFTCSSALESLSTRRKRVWTRHSSMGARAWSHLFTSLLKECSPYKHNLLFSLLLPPFSGGCGNAKGISYICLFTPIALSVNVLVECFWVLDASAHYSSSALMKIGLKFLAASLTHLSISDSRVSISWNTREEAGVVQVPLPCEVPFQWTQASPIV